MEIIGFKQITQFFVGCPSQKYHIVNKNHSICVQQLKKLSLESNNKRKIQTGFYTNWEFIKLNKIEKGNYTVHTN